MALDFQSSLGRKHLGCFQNYSNKASSDFLFIEINEEEKCSMLVDMVARLIRNHHGYDINRRMTKTCGKNFAVLFVVNSKSKNL